MFWTFRVLSLSPSLEPLPNVLCVLRVARIVPDTVRGAVFPVVRVFCALQGEEKHKKKKEKNKQRQEEKSKDNVSKEDKREERKEEEEMDPRGKSKRMVAKDDDGGS